MKWLLLGEKKSNSDKQIRKKENILMLLTLRMLTPLKRHRSGVYCISLKGWNGQGHDPLPLSPVNGENLGRAWIHSWELYGRVSLIWADGYPAGSRNSVFSLYHCTWGQYWHPTHWAGGSPPAAAAAWPCLQAGTGGILLPNSLELREQVEPQNGQVGGNTSALVLKSISS